MAVTWFPLTRDSASTMCRVGLVAGLAMASGCVGEITFDYEGVDAGADEVDGSRTDGAPDSFADAGAPDAEMPPAGIAWKAVLMTGDDSIAAFDNARHEVRAMFDADGLLDDNIIELSRDPGEQVGGVRASSADNLEEAMLDLEVGPDDGCVVFMTSHGSQEGFYIRGQNTLTPGRLAQILDDACADRPTIALISACYSGVFVDPVAAPNRIILTAAREDRTSFGCSAESTYTYWDGCLVDSFGAVDTWLELYDTVAGCIESKEGVGGFTPSLPQGFFGADVRDLGIFARE